MPLDLPKTHVPRGDGPPAKSSFPPTLRLAAEHKQKNAALAFAFVCLLVAIGSILLAIRWNREPQYVFVMDQSGNIEWGQLQSMKQNNQLPFIHAQLAARAILEWSPTGPDNEELAKEILAPAVWKQVQETEFEAVREDFRARDIYQNLYVETLRKFSESASGEVIVVVQGKVNRHGSVGGYATREIIEFKLSVRMVRNPNMIKRGNWPYRVNEYKLTW